MTELVLAIAVFTALHVVPSTPLRGRLIGLLGRRNFLWAFSAASLLLFAWVWLAYRFAAVETVFWATGPFIRWASAILMLGALALAVLAALQRPSVLLTAETALQQPDALTGVVRITRHPLLWAIGLWGLVHMLNNPDPPSWLFFGYVSVLALAGTWLIDRRRSRLLGARWAEIAARTSNVPFAAIAQGRNRLIWSELPPAALAGAVALWLLLLFLHPWLFGMPAVWL